MEDKYLMNLDTYISKLRQLTTEAVNTATERSILLSANQLLAEIKNRIQTKGTDSSGKKMKAYSERSGYYNRDKFVKKGAFEKRGKNRSGDFLNGNTRRTMYLQHGYRQFREIQGRQTQVRDLNLSGDLMKSYVLGQTEGIVRIGFDSRKESVKRLGNEGRNGAPIFSAQTKEMTDYKKRVVDQQNQLVTKIFES